MQAVANRHQMRIARETLKMTPEAAAVLGGMTHAEAFYLVFRQDIHARAAELAEAYPSQPESVAFEMNAYGWSLADFVRAFK